MIIILMSLFFLLAELGGLNNYLYQGYLAILFVCGYLSYKISKENHPLLGALFFYVSVLSLAYIAMPMEFYRGTPPLETTVIMGLQVLNTNSFIYILMVVLPFLIIPKENIKDIGAGIYILAFLDTVIMLFKMATHERLAYWLFNNPAMDTAFISCCIPLFLSSVDKKISCKVYLVWVAMPVIVCLMAKTSTGVLGVGVALAAYYWSKHGFQKMHLVYAGIIASFTAFIGYMMQKEVLFQSSGRYPIWRHTFQFWTQQHTSLAAPHIPSTIGSGLGSFFMYGPSLQIQEAIGNQVNQMDVFFWLHNDWAQILFETGYIGLTLTFAVFTIAVYKARKMPAIFASLLAYGSVGFIQMPLRSYVFAVMGMFLIYKAFGSPKKGTGDNAYEKQIAKEY